MAPAATNGADKGAAAPSPPPPPSSKDGSGVDVTVTVSQEEEVDFSKITLSEAYELLDSSAHGLTEAQAQERLARFGPNKLPEAKINPFMRFLSYFCNPLAYAMEVAALLSFVLLDWVDGALVLSLLLINGVVSYIEESSADNAIRALASALAPKAKVIRDGKPRTMDAVDLVPGDVLILKFGDVIPADCKIIGELEHEQAALALHGHGGHDEDQCLQVDQAALTGESLPAKKYTGHTIFSGSAIKQGERHCIVYATGTQTFFGRAAALISATNSVANIQRVMTRISAVCLVTILIWGAIELAVMFGAFRHGCSLAHAEQCPTLTNLLVIIVGGVPIAMPTVLTVTLALGASQLAKEGAIVARMSAVEELAGVDILCSDKTGTLTLNKLTVDTDTVQIYEPGLPLQELLRYGALSANVITEEAIDVVLHASYPNADGLFAPETGRKVVRYVPFNPTDKFTMAVIEEPDPATGGTRTYRVMKGAPQVVLKRAHNVEAISATAERHIVEYANRGYRALGIGLAEGAGAADAPGTVWRFLGLVPLFDPPRHDTKETIEELQRQGVEVKMVTGDQQLIGAETARQLGMGTNIYKVSALLEASKNGGAGGAGSGSGSGKAAADGVFGEFVEKADGFAEVFPEHKFMIVDVLQQRGHVVAMTGDGVNDAPALKKGDVGIAVHGATAAAQGAADLVLTEPGLSVIGTAVIGARRIFRRMQTYARYTVAMTFRICFTFGLLTVLYDWPFPTILIVMLAVLNDGAMIALSQDRATPSPVPNRWCLRNIFIGGAAHGLFLTVSTWALYHLATKTPFFASKGAFSLEDTPQALEPFCSALLASKGLDPSASAAKALYPSSEGFPSGITVMQQCVAEQKYVRGAQARSLIYLQVSISGQALVFVTRTARHSFAEAAAPLTYVAFFAAQAIATLVAALGFNGYPNPSHPTVPDCQLCDDSRGAAPAFFSSRKVPAAGTESAHTASVIGCTYYVIVAWIWALIWHMGLDPIKWLLAFALNEDGVRDKLRWHKFVSEQRPHGEDRRLHEEGHELQLGAAAANYTNPLGRGSIVGRVPKDMLARASVVAVEPAAAGGVGGKAGGGPTSPRGGLRRVSANPYHRSSVESAGAAARRASLDVGGPGAGGGRRRRGSIDLPAGAVVMPAPTLANSNPFGRASLVGAVVPE